MKILIANLGSTSFKYRLYDMEDESQLARGGSERIGAKESRTFVEIGSHQDEFEGPIADHSAAVEQCLTSLTHSDHGCLNNVGDVAGIGLKAVLGGRYDGAVIVDDDVLNAMEEVASIAPAHNPPYITAMRQFRERLPCIPIVAAFETGFHATIPARQRTYAVPMEWAEKHHIRKWGYHGASHRYIAERTAEIAGRSDLRVISCHLGGSSSLCAIRNGKSAATSMGMSPQTGLPQNNRVGDFDPFAVRLIMERTGDSMDEVLATLGAGSGLLGIYGESSDLRDIESAAAKGNARARLAIDVYVTSIRNYLGALFVELGGADWIVFTGGIGENSAAIRREVCAGLEFLGVRLNESANGAAVGEAKISCAESRVAVWVTPTNEEIIVARQTRDLLARRSAENAS